MFIQENRERIKIKSYQAAWSMFFAASIILTILFTFIATIQLSRASIVEALKEYYDDIERANESYKDVLRFTKLSYSVISNCGIIITYLVIYFKLKSICLKSEELNEIPASPSL